MTAAATQYHWQRPERRFRPSGRIFHEKCGLESGRVELLVFLFFGLVAIVAMMGCLSELLQLLGTAVFDQTVRALLTK